MLLQRVLRSYKGKVQVLEAAEGAACIRIKSLAHVVEMIRHTDVNEKLV